MCGIAGVILKNERVGKEMLQSAAERLSHRGPDGLGFFTEDNVGLVHTRLSIIDLQSGQQPILSGNGQLALVANGEIYNFVELREELEAAGQSFNTHSDSETILHGYALDPEGFVERLHGMFAFALYDRARRRVVIARDRLGIKPLYYAVLPGRVVFASEIKALLPLLGKSPEINPSAFVQFLQNQFNTGEETILKEVRRVLPGETIIIAADLSVTRRQYWTPLHVATRAIGYEEAAEEFDVLFRQVMHEHIRSDVPYGLFLSGGIDSAILLAMLNRIHDEPIRTFSVGYRDVDMKDELPDAERIAKQFRTEHTSLRLDRKTVFGHLVRTVWAADDLMRDYASLPTSVLAEHAGSHLKVVFTGEGGDEVFAGYGRYRASPLVRFFKNMIAPGSDGFRTRGQLQARWLRRLLGPELTAANRAFRAPTLAAWKRTPDAWSYLQRAQYTDMVTALPDNLLVKADRMLMSFGVEGRVPFLDHRIVEFGLSLPDGLKTDGRTGKYFLRRWAEGLLPSDHLYRKKRGFHIPVGEWLQGDFLDGLERKLKTNQAVNTWFDPRVLPDLFAAQRTQGNVAREIWSLMQFAIWHRLFIEQPGARPSSDENPLEWIS